MKKVRGLWRDPVFWGIVLPPFFLFYFIIFCHRTIGADYLSGQLIEPVQHRFYHLFGLEPMWDMTRTGGIPYSGNPSVQPFHLPRWLLMHLPWFMSGHAVIILAIKHLALLMITQTASYLALRRLAGFGKLGCYLFSFLAAYNLATLDAFRYGIGLDSFAYGYLLVLSALLYLDSSQPWLLVAVAAFAQFLFTSSYYPTIPTVALIGGGSAALFAYYRKIRLKDAARKLVLLGFASVCGVLMAAPNWIGLTELLESNYRRVYASSLDWANFAPLDLKIGAFFNFARPWGAEIHSGFGGSTLLPLGLGGLGLMLLRKPRLWPLLLWLLFPLAYAMGTQTPVFVFFYKHVPGFNSIRVPGRILVLLPLIVLTIACVTKDVLNSKKDWRLVLKLTAVVNAAMLVVALLFQVKYPSIGWRGSNFFMDSPENFYPGFWVEKTKTLWILLGLFACVMAYLQTAKSFAVLAILTFAQTWMVISHGTWSTERIASETYARYSSRDFLPAYPPGMNTENLAGAEGAEGFATVPFTLFARAAGNAMNCFYPLNADQPKVGVALPYYLSDNVLCRENDQEIYDSLKKDPACTATSIIHTYAAPPVCDHRPARALTNQSLRELNEKNRLLVFTPNLVKMSVETKRDALFITRYPLITSNWRASIDGVEAPPVKVNGGFVGVWVPAGRHVVMVSYFSKKIRFAYNLFFAGLLALSLGLLGIYRKRLKRQERIEIACLIVAFVAVGAIWTQRIVTSRATAELVLPNSYQKALQIQLVRWAHS